MCPTIAIQYIYQLLCWLLSKKPVSYISSPGVEMFHPAQQQHSYIAHIYERHVLMKTVIELLYISTQSWYLVDCTWCINDLFCSAMQINSSRFPIAMGDGFPGQEFNGWPCPPPLLSHAIEKMTTQLNKNRRRFTSFEIKKEEKLLSRNV